MVAPLNILPRAFLQLPQHTWTPSTVTLAAFFLLAVFLVFSSLPSQVAWPKNPPLRSASYAFRAVLASVAVKVTVLASLSHLAAVTPSTLPRIPATALMQFPQHRCTPLTSTFSAR